jgi:hypothetical protein
VYEQDDAIWLELTGSTPDQPLVYRVTALHFYLDLALLALDDGTVVMMRLADVGSLQASQARAAILMRGGNV